MKTNPKASLLEKAIGIAVRAHRGQRDKSGAPYILHPLRVMHRVDTETDRIVAVLHDVIEDTATTVSDLRREGFTDDIVEALAGVTKRAGESYGKFIRRAASNPIARRVKLADLEDNMDVRRLSTVTQRDAKRLRKYLAAWRRLQAAPPLITGLLYGPDEG
jgi:(p)ppGpp synthase/HD superfamily hydrolase